MCIALQELLVMFVGCDKDNEDQNIIWEGSYSSATSNEAV